MFSFRDVIAKKPEAIEAYKAFRKAREERKAELLAKYNCYQTTPEEELELLKMAYTNRITR